jgi:transposase
MNALSSKLTDTSCARFSLKSASDFFCSRLSLNSASIHPVSRTQNTVTMPLAPPRPDSDLVQNSGNDNPGTYRSYSREYKIFVLNWHKSNGSVTHKSPKHFNITRQNIIRWIRDEATRDTNRIGRDTNSEPSGYNNGSDKFNTYCRVYSREHKISVIDWHRRNGSIKNETSRTFNIARQNVGRWIRAETAIRSAKKRTKHVGRGRSAAYPLLECRLHKEFLDLRSKGAKIHSVWFMTR